MPSAAEVEEAVSRPSGNPPTSAKAEPATAATASTPANGKKKKPCKVCSGFGEAFGSFKPPAKPAASAKKTEERVSPDASVTSAAVASGAAAAAVAQEQDMPARYKGCPESAESLGRAGWSFLHTVAAYYPEEPTKTEQKDMGDFVRLIGTFYPCGECAAHLRDYTAKNKPDTSSATGLARWFCGAHNDVNRRLNKPLFDCSKVNERWFEGWEDGSCDQ